VKALNSSVLLLVLLPGVALAQNKTKKPKVAAIFEHAQYVYVEAIDGEGFEAAPNPDDLQAIANVEDALRQWNRYALTTRREDANFVIVVRKGRAVVGKAGVIIASTSGPGAQGSQYPGQPRGAGTAIGTTVGGEAGTPDDLFEVCQINPNGTLSTPLWMRTFPDGLDKPRVMLFEQFKDAVERAYPSQPAGQQATNQPQKP